MMTIFDKLNDDRGVRCKKICTIPHAVDQSGYAKEFLANNDETGRFWSTAFITGFLFSFMLQVCFLILGISSVSVLFSAAGALVFVFGAVGFGVVMGGVVKLYGWRSPKHARQAMIRAALCPSCAYSIAELIPESDGCAVCPECGAAWRFDG
tara:strand:+ start:21 stop:476 length:456 start_codon:yes stop_codon:yes gene_type:complete